MFLKFIYVLVCINSPFFFSFGIVDKSSLRISKIHAYFLLLMGIWVPSGRRLLWIELLWIFLYMSFCRHTGLFLQFMGVDLLCHRSCLCVNLKEITSLSTSCGILQYYQQLMKIFFVSHFYSSKFLISHIVTLSHCSFIYHWWIIMLTKFSYALCPLENVLLWSIYVDIFVHYLFLFRVFVFS